MNALYCMAIALLLFTPLLAACGDKPSKGPAAGKVAQSKLERVVGPDVPAADQEALVSGDTAFALDLYQVLRSKEDNLFYSPYSISLALAMTYAGARGQTEAEMASTLRFTLPQDRLHTAFNGLDQVLASRGQSARGRNGDGFRLHVINALWGQQDYTFLPPYLDTLATNYGAGLGLLDFAADAEQARVIINDWASDETQGRIQNLIPPGVLDELTRLVLTNAIYFNAAWAHPFERGRTAEGVFHLLDGSQATVPMMVQTETFRYDEGKDFQAVELPYDGRQLSMVVLVPSAGNFESFEDSLNVTRLDQVLSALQSQSVALSLPRFQFNSSFSLVEALQTMGMRAAFGMGADFSGMDSTPMLFIGDVLHQAFVSVDEAGTEAAAATAVEVGLKGFPEEPVTVTVDRPFLFAIRDIETGTILFLGRCTNPTE
jgi:serpin B